MRKFPSSPKSSKVEIFARDRFPSSLFGLIVVPFDFMWFRGGQSFGASTLVRKFHSPPGSVMVVIFACDRILSSSFGLTEVPV